MKAFLALSFMTTRELFSSPAVKVTLTSEAPPEIPHLRLISVTNQDIDSETINSILDATDSLLDKGEHFKSSWDLRNCKVPSMPVVAKCIKWALSRKSKLDNLNKRMAVCMPDRPALMSVVRLVLKAFGPVCPVKVSNDVEECEEFMKQC